MQLTPFFDSRADCLRHPEVHQVILHLHNPERWPLPGGIDELIGSLEDEPRRWAEFAVSSVEDPNFAPFAKALEQATLKVEAECG